MRNNLVTWCVLSIVFLLGLFGIALMGISWIPFGSAKSFIDALAPDGRSEQFTSIVYQGIAARFRGIGFAFLVVACVLCAGRKKASVSVRFIMDEFLCELRVVVRNMLEALRGEEKTHLSALLVILLSALAVRLWFLFEPMRYDEAFTFLQFASKPLYRGLSDYSYPNNHPMHTFLVHIAYRILGNEPWVIRLPAFCAGVLTVVASYITARIAFDKRAALLTASFVASSPVLILYSTNARGYMLICLIFLILYALGASLLQKSTPTQWLLFSIISAAGFFTIPVMIYPFGIIVLWLCLSIMVADQLIDRRAFMRNLLLSLTAVLVLTGLAYMPIYVLSGLESLVANRFVTSLSWSSYSTHAISYLYSIAEYLNKDLPVWVSLPCAAGFIASCIFYWRLKEATMTIIAAVLIWSIALLSVQRVLPYQRVWLFLVPLYFGFACSGMNLFMSHLEKKIKNHARTAMLLNAGVPVMIALCLTSSAIHTKSIVNATETGTLRDAEQITLFMKEYLKPGDAVYAPCPSDSPLIYYFMRYHVPVAYLYPGMDANHKRAVVIVNHRAHQTLAGILGEAHLRDRGFGAAKALKIYDSATLYEMHKVSGK